MLIGGAAWLQRNLTTRDCPDPIWRMACQMTGGCATIDFVENRATATLRLLIARLKGNTIWSETIDGGWKEIANTVHRFSSHKKARRVTTKVAPPLFATKTGRERRREAFFWHGSFSFKTIFYNFGSFGFQGVRCRADCESALRALCIQPDSQSGGSGKANAP